ncbi:unnamed protein product [Lepeophtheirus salmonis]|uniref:(salmon louse) hypothetical protein n=1 Tax=Lepeophtheirus salmonis TaxID=72036 RepID=A0A0K2SVP4_LEPSM|nr:unnamed protein product [Lepeophtheirus salmonis]CAF2798750.1 unnamed protein product [Lepeophtheirus salmonis]
MAAELSNSTILVLVSIFSSMILLFIVIVYISHKLSVQEEVVSAIPEDTTRRLSVFDRRISNVKQGFTEIFAQYDPDKQQQMKEKTIIEEESSCFASNSTKIPLSP